MPEHQDRAVGASSDRTSDADLRAVADPAESRDLPRRIHTLGAAAIMIGIIVGSGIFQTPTEVAKHLGNPWLILLAWTLGGVVSFFGALTYAELAGMFPRSGGIYVFLYEGLGPAVAFVFGWTYLLVAKPAAAAGIATVFASHVNRLLGTEFDERLIVCVVLTLLTLINTFRVTLGEGVAMLLTAGKIGALVGIIVLGGLMRDRAEGRFEPAPAPTSLLLALAPVFAGVMWTYDGWSDVGSIAGEVKNPQRALPRVFLLGTAGVTLLYLGVNAVYLWMIPLEQMRAVPTVAPLVMERLLGPTAERVVTALVVVSTLGASHGSILTGARVTFGQARDGLLFRPLGRIHPRFQTPAVSLWVQLVLSCVAVMWFRGFGELTSGFVFTMWVFYALAAVGLIVLRKRRPDLPRPFRCWGYPLVPITFVVVAIGMIALEISGNPRRSLTWLVVLLAGAPMYLIWKRLQRRDVGRA
ncbi:MAG: amino acid permease [Phycisphaerae bacterium]|nr:MAG: amino acid permease [Planctomycetota bacterium]KAB2941131.1 MAG: amino acid permease [Phycisphaerae bacterium]MBE7456942.1 amino acid permease [Planctomycetia bacterium]MCK6466237.1 amino acid permease [Phycisphaerae bacterium]MCL4719986.1 amino acid permease [Phycisphaerae bacterium]